MAWRVEQKYAQLMPPGYWRRRAKRVGGRVQRVQLFDTGTRECPFFVTLKPKHFPNRSTLGRFLDQIHRLSRRSVRDASGQ
jgi:hypothetical protein